MRVQGRRASQFRGAIQCVLGFLLFVMLLAGNLRAQIAEGAITGFITDPSGAAIPGSSVEARNIASGVVTHTISSSVGYYEFPLLLAGSYTVAVKQRGFQRTVTAPIVLHSGDKLRIDIKVNIGRETQSVEVTAAAPLINATTTNLGTVIGSKEISQLPLNGRTFTQLLTLEPGWNEGTSTAQRGGASLNGLPGLGNNFLLDGVDMSFGENNGVGMSAISGATGMLINYVSIDAIQEIKATTGAASAQYGRMSGGTVNLTTKSGTNQFHGTAWEYVRNDAFDTSSFFSNLNHLKTPELRQNQFGGNLGGPILHNKLFFFFNYEGARAVSGQTVTGNVPTSTLLGEETNPELAKFLQMWYPAPTTTTSNPLVGLYFHNAASRDVENTTLTRVDGNFGKHRLTFRMVADNQNLTNPVLSPALLQYFPIPTRNYEGSWTYLLSPTLVNEFRFGYNSNPIRRHTAAIDTSLDQNVPGVGFLTKEAYSIAAPGLSSLSTVDSLAADAPTKSIVEDLTWVHGTHTIKTGIALRRTDAKRIQFGQGVWYEYFSLNHLIEDTADTFELDFGNPGNLGMDFWTYDAYGQDNWKVSRRLTLDYGLHYSYFQALKGPIGLQTSNPFGPTTPLDTPLWHPNYKDFSPRIGFVYNLTSDGKTVFRSGFGTFYGAAQPFFIFNGNWLSAQVPAFPIVNAVDLPASISTKFPGVSDAFLQMVRDNPSTAPSGLAGGRFAPDPNHHDEYSEQWNATLERELAPSIAISASYVGNRTLHEYSSVLENPINPATGIRPFADIGPVWLLSYSGRLWYNGLEVSLRKTTSHALSFDVFYTYSKSMQYGGADQTTSTDSTTQDFNNIAGSIGPTPGEVTHRLSADYAYAIPTGRLTKNSALARGLIGGWSLEGIIGASTGPALNIVTGEDAVGTGRSNGQRPDAVPGISAYANGANRLQFLNSAAFDTATPIAQKRYGNLGYDTVFGPGAFTWDASIHKTWKIHENQNLTFRFEMFNMLNHVVLGSPDTTTTSPTFGQITTGSDGRELQFALRYTF